MAKETHPINSKDLFLIVSDAKGNMANQRSRPSISNKEVEQGDLPTLAVIEAFISYLNGKGLLDKHIELDYTDDCNKFEELD